MPRFARSFRDGIRAAKRGNDYYADLAGKPRIDYSDLLPAQKEVQRRVDRTPDPNAPPLEREVLKAVLKYLSHHPSVGWCCRVNSGMLQLDDDRFVRFNSKRGMADIIGQMRTGAFMACEVKREGAQLMDHQREFLNEVIRNGGVAFVARNITDAEEALRQP